MKVNILGQEYEIIKQTKEDHNGKKTIGQCIDYVPTIIEADKEEEK